MTIRKTKKYLKRAFREGWSMRFDPYNFAKITMQPNDGQTPTTDDCTKALSNLFGEPIAIAKVRFNLCK